MDYRACAEELLQVVSHNEEAIRLVLNNLTDLFHGELGALTYLLNQHDSANAKDLSQKLRINTSRVAAILNSLEKKGYIERRQDPRDKRMVRVLLTEAGIRYAEKRREEVIDLAAGTLAYLGEEDTREWLRIVGRLRERADEIVRTQQ